MIGSLQTVDSEQRVKKPVNISRCTCAESLSPFFYSKLNSAYYAGFFWLLWTSAVQLLLHNISFVFFGLKMSTTAALQCWSPASELLQDCGLLQFFHFFEVSCVHQPLLRLLLSGLRREKRYTTTNAYILLVFTKPSSAATWVCKIHTRETCAKIV